MRDYSSIFLTRHSRNRNRGGRLCSLSWVPRLRQRQRNCSTVCSRPRSQVANSGDGQTTPSWALKRRVESRRFAKRVPSSLPSVPWPIRRGGLIGLITQSISPGIAWRVQRRRDAVALVEPVTEVDQPAALAAEWPPSGRRLPAYRPAAGWAVDDCLAHRLARRRSRLDGIRCHRETAQDALHRLPA